MEGISTALRPEDYLTNPLGHTQALVVGMLMCVFAYITMLIVPRFIPVTLGIDIASIEEQRNSLLVSFFLLFFFIAFITKIIFE